MSRHAGRVRVLPALPREQVLARLGDYDIGLCLLPVTPVMTVSSPIKIFEYYACGLPVVMTEIPACRELFDEQTGWFCAFERDAIRLALTAAIAEPPEQVQQRGLAGQAAVRRRRAYPELAAEFALFLQTQVQRSISQAGPGPNRPA